MYIVDFGADCRLWNVVKSKIWCTHSPHPLYPCAACCSQSIPIGCAVSKLCIIFSVYIVIYFRSLHVKMVYSRSAPSPPTWWSPRGWRESWLTMLIQTSEKEFQVHVSQYSFDDMIFFKWDTSDWIYEDGGVVHAGLLGCTGHVSYFNLIVEISIFF